LDDDLIVGKASLASNGDKFVRLFHGADLTGYPSQSEADLALCCLLAFYTQDPDQLARLFARSALSRRGKWDARPDYRTRTVTRALALCSTAYQVSGGAPAPAVRIGGSVTVDYSQEVLDTTLMRLRIVPARFLIRGLIPDGLTILSAPSKTYKSFFALSLALATIGASDWCGAFPVEEQGEVVFFGLESPPNQLHNRLLQLLPAFNPASMPHHIHFFSGMTCLPPFKDGLQSVLEEVIDRYRPRLLVIDPLTYLYRLGKQQDLASMTLDLLWPLAEMAASAGISLFCAEHLRKPNKDDSSVVDQLNGSYIKAAVVHALLSIQREGENLTIDTTLRDAASQHLTLGIEFGIDGGITWRYKGTTANVAETRRESLRTMVYAELSTHRIPVTAGELIATLGLPNTQRSKDAMRQILHRAEKDGNVASSKRGEYYWIDAAP
jgi:hypothetical protein